METLTGMNAKEFMDLLHKLEACREARTWAKGKDLAEVWQTCERGDWLLWLCGRMVGKEGWPTRQQVVLAACSCAEQALKYVEAGEDRPRRAIETARAWTNDKATIEEVRTAAAAAYAAYAASAAAYAAYAAAAAAYAAAYAAYAAAYAAAARREVSRLASLKTSADIVRKEIKLGVI